MLIKKADKKTEQLLYVYEKLGKRPDREVVCQYIQHWKVAKDFAKVKNPDLWRRYLEVSRSHTIRAHWIKGHSGIALNEECDKIAKSEAMKFLRSE